jgi:putative membrane protein
MQRFVTWRKHFNWRMLLMRTVVNALALLVTVILVPRIYFEDNELTTWLLVAVLLGLMNAFVKPVIQFAMLRFIFATYGVVVALINAVVLLFLALLLPNRFAVDSLFWATYRPSPAARSARSLSINWASCRRNYSPSSSPMPLPLLPQPKCIARDCTMGWRWPSRYSGPISATR